MKRKNIFITSLSALLGVAALVSCNNGNTPADPTPDTPVDPTPDTPVDPTPELRPYTGGKTYYVAPDAAYDRPGTKADPMNFSDVLLNIAPGDTILMKAGSYKYESRINIEKVMSGNPNYYITIMPENEGDDVTFDFSKMVFRSDNRGIQLYADYWHFKDINICGAGDNGMYVAGSYNIIENCQFYNNRDSGLQLGRALSGDNTVDTWPSYNLIKNCTSFANFDDETYGENADGFAAKLTLGYGNVFDGCIAFRNSDDGWDMYAKQDSGNIGTVYLYNCVSFENGYLPYQIDRTDENGAPYKSNDTLNGDGIGFKLGGSTMEGDVYVENCLSFNNKLHGFGDNSNPGFLNLNYCTAVNNCTGVNEDGTISTVRGIPGTTNKSNNFDLARDNKSYNNYFGLLSFIDNQDGFNVKVDDNSYNTDKFRGSASYSIFQTSFGDQEIYTKFTTPEDASVYASGQVDTKFSTGSYLTDITMNRSIFANIESINAVCASKDDLASLKSIHTTYRNADHSINMGDKCKLVNEQLLKFVDGKSIGSTLTKSSYDEYNHKTMVTFEDCINRDEVIVKSVYNEVNLLTNPQCVYQDFEIVKTINGAEVTWSSSNTDVLVISNEEKSSISSTIYGSVHVIVPDQETKVTLTATISCGGYSKTKTFELNVMHRNQTIGEIKTTSGVSAIRVPVYGVYCEPTLYVVDASSNTLSALEENTYELTYSYRFATDRKSQYYPIDNIYTSVPGVYEVTVTATSLLAIDNYKTSTLKYNVYVVDPDCKIDIIVDEDNDVSYSLTNEGFIIEGALSNIEGYIYAVAKDKAATLTASDVIADPNVQKYTITTDSCKAIFNCDNSKVQFIYYVVANKKGTFISNVYSFQTSIVNISTLDEFHNLATIGKLNASDSVSSTTIYSLQNDLDFSNYTWACTTKEKASAFTCLLNGNGHTVKNLTVTGSSQDGTINVFFKLKNGTIMNLDFDNISIINTHGTNAKKVAIIGDMCGGYLYNIHMTKIYCSGTESVGGLVGQMTGGDNYVSRASLVNPTDEKAPTYALAEGLALEGVTYYADSLGTPLATQPAVGDDVSKLYVVSGERLKYGFHVVKKYVGGIVANIQKDSTQDYVTATIRDCYVTGIIGDGKDSGGCVGGIVGRIKNESEVYFVDVQRCVFYGTIIATGNYDGGIIGGFESGVGKAVVSHNFSDAIIILNGVTFNARENYNNNDQSYAHKNANPIVGRYTVFINGVESQYNYGSWAEYSGSYINSYSFIMVSSGLSYEDDETGDFIEWKMSESFCRDSLTLDLVNVWNYNDETHTVALR